MELFEKVRIAVFADNPDRFMRASQVEVSAAIAAVFDWLAKPSDEALSVVCPRPAHWEGREADPMWPNMEAAIAVDRMVVRQHFEAMLAEMRRAALG